MFQRTVPVLLASLLIAACASTATDSTTAASEPPSARQDPSSTTITPEAESITGYAACDEWITESNAAGFVSADADPDGFAAHLERLNGISQQCAEQTDDLSEQELGALQEQMVDALTPEAFRTLGESAQQKFEYSNGTIDE